MKKIAIALVFAGVSSLMAADGAALYQKCIGCHGAKAEKKALGKSVVVQGQDTATIEASLKEYKAGTRNVAGMGALMKGQVAAYSDEDIKAVSEYITTLK
jgi:cytochrome c553